MKKVIDQIKDALAEWEKHPQQNTWIRLNEDETELICAHGHRKAHRTTFRLNTYYMKKQALWFIKSCTDYKRNTL